MDLNKEYVGSSLKIEISDLDKNENISYGLDFVCGTEHFYVANYDDSPFENNWGDYIVEDGDHTYVFIPAGTFITMDGSNNEVYHTGILTLTITTIKTFKSIDDKDVTYETISQPIPLVELIKIEGYLDTCDNCFEIYESGGKVAVLCKVSCTGKNVKVYKNNSCDGKENELFASTDFTCDPAVACFQNELSTTIFNDGIYSFTIGEVENSNTDEYPIGDYYILNGLVEDIVEDLTTVLCDCGCPSCLECNELDEDYMKDLLTNLNTLLVGYSDRLRKPMEQIKAQLRCDIIPSDLADKCKRDNYKYKGKNDNTVQFKKLAAFYYLVLAQDWLTNAQYLSKLCGDGNNVNVGNLPSYFDYTKVAQCLRTLSINYKLEIPVVEDIDCSSNDTEEK